MSREMKNSGIEWIGQIPKEWEVARAKSIFSQRSSKGNTAEVLLSATQKQGMLPQYMLEGVVQTNANTDLQTFKTVHQNDYVISLRSFQGGFEMSNYEGVCSPAYQVFYNIVPISHQFFWLLFKSYGFIDKINSLTVGIREGKNIQYKEFANMLLAIPSLTEQQKIADYLDKVCGEVDEMVALQEKMIEKLKAYKQSVITEAVTKGLNPNVPMRDSGIDWIGEIPEHWEVCRFKDIASVKANLVHPDDYMDYPQIAPDNIEKASGRLLPYKSVKESNVISDNHLFFKGQIIYSKIRPVLNKLIIAPFDGLCSADMYPIETINDINYQKYYMLSDAFVRQVALVVQDRVKMPKINQNELSIIYVLSLPLSEQRFIASYLDTKCSEIDSLIALKQVKIEELKEYKKSVIYEYVTGKKEVV